jgi:hypothetical protein
LLLPPGLFSMKTCAPIAGPSAWASVRATMSMVPPGAVGTIRRIERAG